MPTRPLRLTQLSFTGMRDSLDPSTADARKALLMQNVYPSDAVEGASAVGRPGFQQSGTNIAAAPVQGIGQYSKLDGTEITVAFCDGGMYRFNWSTRTWSNVVLSGGAVLVTRGPVDTVNFANQLVISDGVNQPFLWDGSAFTVLTNAPVFFGPPTVYYGRLFGVRADQHTTLDWSEPNQPNTGYEAGGFNNSWTLGQTQEDAIHRIQGTNAALYYWRARSTGVITGQVTANFASDGTNDGVSETIGTLSPRAVVLDHNTIYFPDADGKPHAIVVGGPLNENVWPDLRETIGTVVRANLQNAIAASDPLTNMVLIGETVANQTNAQQFIAVDTRTNLIGGLWNGFTATALALVKDGALVPRIMHGTLNGNVYDHGDPAGILWNDANAAADGGTLPIGHVVIGTPLGYDLQYDKVFDRLDLSMRMDSVMTNVSLDGNTPTGATTAQTQTFTPQTGLPLWDTAVWDVDSWALNELEEHFSFGLDDRGRWFAPRLTHSNASERFGLEGWVLTAFPDADDPEIA